MGILALVHHWNIQYSANLRETIVFVRKLTSLTKAAGPLLGRGNVLEAGTALALKSLGQIMAFGTWMAVIQLGELALVNGCARAPFHVPFIVDWTGTFGFAAHNSAHFIQVRFAAGPRELAFLGRCRRPGGTHPAGMGDTIGRFIQEIGPTLARVTEEGSEATNALIVEWQNGLIYPWGKSKHWASEWQSCFFSRHSSTNAGRHNRPGLFGSGLSSTKSSAHLQL
jgi:hypothetical protein